MKQSVDVPWTEKLPFIPLRIIWILASLLILPTIFFKLQLPMYLVPLCSVCAALPACIGTLAQLGIKALRKRDFSTILVIYLIIVVFSAVIGNIWQDFLAGRGYDFAEQQDIIREICNATTIQRVFMFISVCLLTPVVEEVLFRRLIYGLWSSKLWLAATIFTSLLFSLMHFFVLGIPTLFLIGLGCQFICLYRQNLLLSILLHCLINTVAFFANIALN